MIGSRCIDSFDNKERISLVESRSVAITQEKDVTLKSGIPAHVMIGVKDLAGRHDGYLLALATNAQHVVTFEAWGSQKQFNSDQTAIESAVQSLDFGR